MLEGPPTEPPLAVSRAQLQLAIVRLSAVYGNPLANRKEIGSIIHSISPPR
jgi:hypothetical protein